MTDWTRAYGPEGDAYPVRPGEVWRVGPHRLACLDLEDGPRAAAWLAEVTAEGPCAVGFADPPWSAGNARSFRTKAGADGLAGRAVDFPALLDRVIAALAAAVPAGPAWMEIGDAARTSAMIRFRGAGWRGVESWPATYYGDKPCSIIRAVRDEAGLLHEFGPAGQDDAMLPAFAIARDSAPGDRVYDPVTGRGLAATSAARMGRIFRGSELAPRRASVTLARLAAVTGQAATREGTL